MKLLPLFLLMIFLCVLQKLLGVEGRIRKGIIEDDDLELERQLKIINKPTNVTVKTNTGDVYACIDIHQQPALDHPMLKNHKVKVRPTSFSKIDFDKEPSTNRYKHAILERVNCPEGTVPIKRVGKEELRAAKYFSESSRARLNEIRPQTPEFPGLLQALSKLSNGIYRGAGALISVEKLEVALRHFSAAHVCVSDDPKGYRNALWAGWMVSPSSYNDTATHLTIHWTGDGGTGCFNVYCSGFVVTSKTIALGSVFKKVSTGREHYVVDLKIIQEDGGNWLLIVQNETVGYWPKGLVPSLDDGASHLLWGGLTFGLTNERPAPIGNGLYPSSDLYYTSAFLAHMNIVDQKGAVIKAPTNQLESVLDCRESYGLLVVDENESSTLYGGEAEADCTS